MGHTLKAKKETQYSVHWPYYWVTSVAVVSETYDPATTTANRFGSAPNPHAPAADIRSCYLGPGGLRDPAKLIS